MSDIELEVWRSVVIGNQRAFRRGVAWRAPPHPLDLQAFLQKVTVGV